MFGYHQSIERMWTNEWIMFDGGWVTDQETTCQAEDEKKNIILPSNGEGLLSKVWVESLITKFISIEKQSISLDSRSGLV